MREQPDADTPATPPAATTTTTAAKPAPDAWGDDITPDRLAELRDLTERQREWAAQQPQPALHTSVFKDVPLTGADVFWLAALALAVPGGDLDAAAALLRAARDDEELRYLLDLFALHLERANLRDAHLAGASFFRAHLAGASFFGAHLERANLFGAHLAGASFVRAHLAGADLGFAQLAGADLGFAQLAGANLRGATLDGTTSFIDAILIEADDPRPLFACLLRRLRYAPALGDLHWGDFDQVQLTQLVGWEAVQRLADERDVTWRSKADDHRRAVRAYRQVAQRLRDQGYSDIADRLADRAQVLQRKLQFRLLLEDVRRPWRLPGDLGRWLFSWFLALLAGYGYHPGRSVFWYLLTIGGFALLYTRFGVIDGHAFNPLESLVFSLTSFHGRGFFPGGLKLDDPVTVIAAIEAVIGLLIESSFIATFTQRFFGAK